MKDIRLKYQTIEFGTQDIHLCTLRDNQEFSDPDQVAEKLGISSASWPLFGVVWPSSLVLAHHINAADLGKRRILEVGCGIALTSLLLNKQSADITATDYHPESGNFLQRNAHLNGDTSINYERTGWADENDDLGLFDVIIGSDLLYEDEHIELLANFINDHANEICEVVLVDPGRGRKNKITRRMESFGFNAHIEKPAHTDFLEKDFKGHILTYTRH